MPNLANITQPIFIVGPGRSGSSWLVDILAQHPSVQPLIENALMNNMFLELYTDWWSSDWGWICDDQERDRRIVRMMRGMFCELFPGSEPMWAMKMLWRGRSWEFVNQVFPEARYLHIVRSPVTSIPSMMEFMKSKDPLWQELDYVIQEWVQGNTDALSLRDQGRRYLLIRQEEAQHEPEKVWDQISDFLDLSRVPFVELRRAVNLAASTRQLPSLQRPSLPWTFMPPVVRRMCVDLGYLKPQGSAGPISKPPADAAPAGPASAPPDQPAAAPEAGAGPAEPDILEGLGRQVQEKNQTIEELRRKYSELLADYEKLRMGTNPGAAQTAPHRTASVPEGDRSARIVEAATYDDQGRPLDSFGALQAMHLKIKVRADQEVAGPCLGFTVFNKNSGEELFGTNSTDEYLDLPALAPGEDLEVDFGFTQPLTVGLYGVKAYLTDNPAPGFHHSRLLDLVPEITSFRVQNSAMKAVHHKFLTPVGISFCKESS